MTAVIAMATINSMRVKPSRLTLVCRNRTEESISVLLGTNHPQNSHANVIRLNVLVRSRARAGENLGQDAVAPIRRARFFAVRALSEVVVDVASCQDIRTPHCWVLLAIVLHAVVAPCRKRADWRGRSKATVEREPHDVRVSSHRVLVATVGSNRRYEDAVTGDPYIVRFPLDSSLASPSPIRAFTAWGDYRMQNNGKQDPTVWGSDVLAGSHVDDHFTTSSDRK